MCRAKVRAKLAPSTAIEVWCQDEMLVGLQMVLLERLVRFLTALGCQIEIKIGAGTHKKAGKVVVTDVRRRAA